MKPNEFSLSTEDKALYKEVLSLKLQGVRVYPEIKKDLSQDVYNFIISLTDNSSVTVFIAWFLGYLSKRKTKKTSINGKPIPSQQVQIAVFLKNEIRINSNRTDDKK